MGRSSLITIKSNRCLKGAKRIENRVKCHHLVLCTRFVDITTSTTVVPEVSAEIYTSMYIKWDTVWS